MRASTSDAGSVLGGKHLTSTPTKRAASPTKRSLVKVAKIGASSHASSSISTLAATHTTPSQQNVVVCVRVRPMGAQEAGTGSATPTKKAAESNKKKPSEEVREANCWNLDSRTNTISATEQHPALAKRGSSSAPVTSSRCADTSIIGGPDDDSNGSYKFSFDSLTLPGGTSNEIYDQQIAPIIKAAVEGYNATVFAYGQTGSGKTHTMSGSDTEKGIIPSAVHEIFEQIQRVSLVVSFLRD